MWQGNWQQSQNSLLMSTILALHAPIQLRRLCHPESPNDAQSALSPLGGFLCPGLSHRPELCQKDQKQKRESHEASIHRGLSLALALQGCASYAGSFVTSASSGSRRTSRMPIARPSTSSCGGGMNNNKAEPVRKPSAILRYGGGFIVGCLVLGVVGFFITLFAPSGPNKQAGAPAIQKRIVATRAHKVAMRTPTAGPTFTMSLAAFRRRMNYYLQSHDALMRLRDCPLARLKSSLCRIGGIAPDVLGLVGITTTAHGALTSAYIIVRELQRHSGTDRHAALLLLGVALTQAITRDEGIPARPLFATVLQGARNSGSANVVRGAYLCQLWHEKYQGHRQIGYMISATPVA